MKDIAFKENRKHGTIFYPFQCYEMNGRAQQLMVAIHWHEEVEWLYVVEGMLEVRQDGETIELHAGDVFIIESQSIHQITSLSNSHYYAFVFQLNFLDFKLYDSAESKYLIPLLHGRQKVEGIICTRQHPIVKQNIKQLLGCLKEKPLGWELSIKAVLLYLIAYFYQQNFITTQKQVEGRQTLKDIYTYLHEHFDQKISLHDIATYVHLNEQYICRYFKNMSGKGIVDYLNEYRIEEACDKLEHSEDRIVDIAYQCGFENISYFISRFKRVKEVTPFVYRKLKENNTY